MVTSAPHLQTTTVDVTVKSVVVLHDPVVLARSLATVGVTVVPAVTVDGVEPAPRLQSTALQVQVAADLVTADPVHRLRAGTPSCLNKQMFYSTCLSPVLVAGMTTAKPAILDFRRTRTDTRLDGRATLEARTATMLIGSAVVRLLEVANTARVPAEAGVTRRIALWVALGMATLVIMMGYRDVSYRLGAIVGRMTDLALSPVLPPGILLSHVPHARLLHPALRILRSWTLP